MKSINLPSGTTHVPFGELAHVIADALWPDDGPDDERSSYGAARLGLDGELAEAVMSGALPVLNPLTLGPHTFPHGDSLMHAVVRVEDLATFISGRGLAIQSPTTVGDTTPSGRIVPAAPMLKQAAQEERILELLVEAEYEPLRLPDRRPGTKGAKSEIKRAALLEPALFTKKTFDTAWERLRQDGRIAGGE